MTISRRDLVKLGLKAGVGATLLSGVPRWAQAKALGLEPRMPLPITDPWIKELALRAVEAARSAGAQYADVRLTHTWGGGEYLSVGVRALVDGYWGFGASPIWQPDEMARLGRLAVEHARTMAIGPRREVDLARVPVVRDEHWTMPVEIDPFDVPGEEVADFTNGLIEFAKTFSDSTYGISCSAGVSFWTQEKAFASSEGSYCTQRLYRTDAGLSVTAGEYRTSEDTVRVSDMFAMAGMGWEIFAHRLDELHEEIRRLVEEVKRDAALPKKPVEVGRYPLVCDARTVSLLVAATIGRPTQLDVALGYEANAGGTSYLNDPLGMIGTYEVGSPLLTVTANRSEPGGVATVAWDDEGVQPDDFTLVEDGVLQDFQTSRESAAWLADPNVKAGRELRSHGCMVAPRAINAPMIHTPNLRVAPGAEAQDFDDLIAGIDEGLAVRRMNLSMDWQGLNGLGRADRGASVVYEVKNGEIVARIEGAGFLFRAPELWKGLVALGGEGSLVRSSAHSTKGEPPQSTYYNVTAPPAVFEEFTVIDPKRKA